MKLFYALNKTPSRETRCLRNLFNLLAAQAFNSPPFPNTGTLPLTVQYPSDLRDAMPLYWLPSNSHPNLTLGIGGFL